MKSFKILGKIILTLTLTPTLNESNSVSKEHLEVCGLGIIPHLEVSYPFNCVRTTRCAHRERPVWLIIPKRLTVVRLHAFEGGNEWRNQIEDTIKTSRERSHSCPSMSIAAVEKCLTIYWGLGLGWGWGVRMRMRVRGAVKHAHGKGRTAEKERAWRGRYEPTIQYIQEDCEAQQRGVIKWWHRKSKS